MMLKLSVLGMENVEHSAFDYVCQYSPDRSPGSIWDHHMTDAWGPLVGNYLVQVMLEVQSDNVGGEGGTENGLRS